MKRKLERNAPHQTYQINGLKVPGVTTVLSELSKGRILLNWANSQGLKGIDINKDRTATDIGSIAHFLIDCHLNNHEPDLDDFAKTDIDKATLAYEGYLELEKKHGIRMIGNEMQLTSIAYGYGGTLDLYAEMGGVKTLVDFKTSKAIYPEYKIQLAAYKRLLEEGGFTVDQCYIFRIDKEDGSFDDKKITLTGKEWELFLALKKVYDLRKEAKI